MCGPYKSLPHVYTQQNAPMTDILAALHSHKNLNEITNIEKERTNLNLKFLATEFWIRFHCAKSVKLI